jgi:hypothetical protein
LIITIYFTADYFITENLSFNNTYASAVLVSGSAIVLKQTRFSKQKVTYFFFTMKATGNQELQSNNSSQYLIPLFVTQCFVSKIRTQLRSERAAYLDVFVSPLRFGRHFDRLP